MVRVTRHRFRRSLRVTSAVDCAIWCTPDDLADLLSGSAARYRRDCWRRRGGPEDIGSVVVLGRAYRDWPSPGWQTGRVA